MNVTDDLLNNARAYAAAFDKRDLHMQPARHIAPGIAPTDRQSVFEPFQRRDDLTTSAGPGVGLGWSWRSARGFIEAMHGSISLEDTRRRPHGQHRDSLAMSLVSEEYRSASSIR